MLQPFFLQDLGSLPRLSLPEPERATALYTRSPAGDARLASSTPGPGQGAGSSPLGFNLKELRRRRHVTSSIQARPQRPKCPKPKCFLASIEQRCHSAAPTKPSGTARAFACKAGLPIGSGETVRRSRSGISRCEVTARCRGKMSETDAVLPHVWQRARCGTRIFHRFLGF